MGKKLVELAKTIRSKNAGVDHITFDIIFKDRENYNLVKASKRITKENMAGLFNIPVSKITDFVVYDPGLAIKFTIKRDRPSGSPGENDRPIGEGRRPLPRRRWQLDGRHLLGPRLRPCARPDADCQCPVRREDARAEGLDGRPALSPRAIPLVHDADELLPLLGRGDLDRLRPRVVSPDDGDPERRRVTLFDNIRRGEL